MNIYGSLIFSLILSLMLPGCGIGGFWMNGDPFAYKDIKPYMEHWTKPGMTAQSRLADWLACGGDRDGGFSYDIKTNSLPTETQAETQKRLKGNFQRCLIKHGYRYAGCDQGLFQGEPICGG